MNGKRIKSNCAEIVFVDAESIVKITWKGLYKNEAAERGSGELRLVFINNGPISIGIAFPYLYAGIVGGPERIASSKIINSTILF